MGIDGKIRSDLRTKYCPEAFLTYAPTIQNGCFLDDLLTRAFRSWGPSKGGTFTTLQFFEFVFKPIQECLWSNRYDVYVMIVDNAEGVPVQKKEEQARRSRSSNIIPYDNSCYFTDAGIVNGNVTSTFSANRLFMTRELRIKLWQYIEYKLKGITWPANKLLVFDYERRGPHLYCMNRHRCATELYHDLGEADLSINYYCWLFHDRSVTISTIDTDLLPLMALYLEQSPPDCIPPSIYWKYNDGNRSDGKNVYVDIKLLFQRIYTQFRMNTTQFVLFCILCETDYVQKKWLSFFSGLDHILEAVRRTPELLTINTQPDQIESALQQYVQALFTVKIQCSKPYTNPNIVAVMSEQECKQNQHYTPKSRWPNTDDFKKAKEMILFNYNYWKSNWTPQSIDKQWSPVVF
jgi:hypothetical protein